MKRIYLIIVLAISSCTGSSNNPIQGNWEVMETIGDKDDKVETLAPGQFTMSFKENGNMVMHNKDINDQDMLAKYKYTSINSTQGRLDMYLIIDGDTLRNWVMNAKHLTPNEMILSSQSADRGNENMQFKCVRK